MHDALEWLTCERASGSGGEVATMELGGVMCAIGVGVCCWGGIASLAHRLAVRSGGQVVCVV